MEDATFTALHVTDDERDEIDEQASGCGLNRSAFVTAVAQLALGRHLADVVAEMATGDSA